MSVMSQCHPTIWWPHRAELRPVNDSMHPKDVPLYQISPVLLSAYRKELQHVVNTGESPLSGLLVDTIIMSSTSDLAANKSAPHTSGKNWLVHDMKVMREH